ncbi:MAG: hypothetical protein L0G99_07395 [Propionibacteriales bacterium]|nr:hypothetical protein [Propionibacteriales bacterium]
MSSWMLAALLVGASAAAAVVCLIMFFLPTTPDLATTITRLHRRPVLTHETPSSASQQSWSERLGGWVMPRTGWLPSLAVPYSDLDLLDLTVSRFFGMKALGALVGLALPSLLGGIASMLGMSLGIALPVVASLALMVLMWLLPHVLVKRDATEARQRFSRAITAYIDLVVLERLSGATLASSITEPAGIADAPLFRRIRIALNRSQLERKAPWVALRELAQSIEVPELKELADTMELSGTKSAPISEQLKARAGDIRNAWLNKDVEAAGAASERQVAVSALLLMCFVAFLGAPALMQLL